MYDSIDMWNSEIKRIDKERHLLVAKGPWSPKDELRATELDTLLEDLLEKIRLMRVKLLENMRVTSVS